MSWRQRVLKNCIVLSEEEAEASNRSYTGLHPVEVRPPRNSDTPPVPTEFIKGILEIQNKWFGLKNTSPTTAFEITRAAPDNIIIQYVAPSKRLERKIRTQITDQAPGVELLQGSTELPVNPEESIGGGLLSPGRRDYYPFKTGFTEPATNSVTALLHRHAIQDTKIVIQILFKPIAARRIQNMNWRRKAVKQRDHLRKEKQKIWGSTQPTERDRQKANKIDRKIDTARYWTCIRFLIIGAGEQTPSRVKEIAGGFNRFENPDTDQYFNASTLESLRRKTFLSYLKAVHSREFNGFSLKFRASQKEVAALTAVPDKNQENLQKAQP